MAKASTSFKPGQSGNPGGRPKIATALKANGLDANKLTEELVKELIAVVRSEDKKSASWRFAVETLLNHVVGKPKETFEFVGSRDLGEIAGMTDEELLEIVEADHISSSTH